MKQIDYLKLVATGRKSVHYARPSDADDALMGLVGYGFVVSLGLTFVIGIVAPWLGATVDARDVGAGLAATALPGILFFAFGFFIGGAPRLVRYCFLAIGAATLVVLTLLALYGQVGAWFLYVPSFLYSAAVSLGATNQL